MFKIEIGVTATDTVSGFKGVVTGRCEYISGCRQYLLTPQSKEGKPPEGVWFDEDRLRVEEDKRIILGEQKPAVSTATPRGGPQAFEPPAK